MTYLQEQRCGVGLQARVALLSAGAGPLRRSVEPLRPMMLSYEIQQDFCLIVVCKVCNAYKDTATVWEAWAKCCCGLMYSSPEVERE